MKFLCFRQLNVIGIPLLWTGFLIASMPCMQKQKTIVNMQRSRAFKSIMPLLRKHYEGMQSLVHNFTKASLDKASPIISLSTFLDSINLTEKEKGQNGDELLQGLRVEHNIILLMLDTELTYLRKEGRKNSGSIHFYSWLCSIHSSLITRLSIQLKKLK